MNTELIDKIICLIRKTAPASGPDDPRLDEISDLVVSGFGEPHFFRTLITRAEKAGINIDVRLMAELLDFMAQTNAVERASTH